MRKTTGVMTWLVLLVICVFSPACPADCHYVATNGASVAPYTNWSQAANTLALALGASVNGDTIVISNGTYEPAATTWVSKSVVITGLYGAGQTVFDGNGQAFHCLTVNPGPLTTTVFGVTISNFASAAINLTAGGNSVLSLVDCEFRNNINWAGGALYVYSGRLQATNCIFKGNRATHTVYAGGAINYMSSYPNNGSLVNCEISDNSAINGYAGGLMLGNPVTMMNCTISNNVCKQYGGGIYALVGGSLISHCLIVDNVASGSYGGGVYVSGGSELRNCLVSGNSGATYGGGVTLGGGALMRNCTVVSNLGGRAGGFRGVTAGDRAINSIIYYNATTEGGFEARSNYYLNGDACFFTNCCTAPDPADYSKGVGCIVDSPGFSSVAGMDLRLSPDSLCVNIGTNEDWMFGAKDLDGHGRIDFFQRKVDLGAYEYVSEGTMFLFMGQ